ncbi:MAG TPA: GntG family PLP-dependent aldolase [Haliangiales bacterium]|nr:GntG family PLP-dependent aldolase [Haliangiales bacterium]
MIDLRSDTVTRPTPAMREAMARAEVGDDVFGEDPTVNRLQARVAELLGFDSALYVPSGTMANQICLRILTEPGDDVIVGQGAHNWLYETGAGGALAGVQFTLVGAAGLFSGDDVRAAYKPDIHVTPPTSLVCVENTHNRGGGKVWPAAATADVQAAARELGLRLHLDGARLWNAAVASGRAEKDLAAGFDTVSVCLSKGLGAPVGSLVVCSTEKLYWKAHRVRKMYGGGMRQAGILAAAGLYALEHHRARLAEDHANARRLAELLGVDTATVDTNIVMWDLATDAAPVVARAKDEGVLAYAIGPRRIRLVTHLDVDRQACERAAEVLRRAM